MKNKLNGLLMTTIDECFQRGILSETPLPDYVIETPNNPDHGDFATNLALTLASSQKRNPRKIAAASPSASPTRVCTGVALKLAAVRNSAVSMPSRTTATKARLNSAHPLPAVVARWTSSSIPTRI